MNLRTICVVLMFMASASVSAQPAPNGGGRVFGGGGMVAAGGGGQRFRPAQLEFIKNELGLSDDEWKTLSPKIEKVMDARMNTQTGAGMSVSSQNGGAPAVHAMGGNVPTEAGKALKDVKDSVSDASTSDEAIVAKLAALKEAKEKARAQLDAAQKEL